MEIVDKLNDGIELEAVVDEILALNRTAVRPAQLLGLDLIVLHLAAEAQTNLVLGINAWALHVVVARSAINTFARVGSDQKFAVLDAGLPEQAVGLLAIQLLDEPGLREVDILGHDLLVLVAEAAFGVLQLLVVLLLGHVLVQLELLVHGLLDLYVDQFVEVDVVDE